MITDEINVNTLVSTSLRWTTSSNSGSVAYMYMNVGFIDLFILMF